jgi:isopentenyl phosphate kinase
MSNAKSMGATFMVNLVMFIVLIVITFGPPAIIMKDYFDAVMEGNISKAIRAIEDVGMLPIVLIVLHGAYVFVCFTVERLKTKMTRYWAYLSIFNIVWWIYLMV